MTLKSEGIKKLVSKFDILEPNDALMHRFYVFNVAKPTLKATLEPVVNISSTIDFFNLISKWQRAQTRSIEINKFCQWHYYSIMLRLGIKTLEDVCPLKLADLRYCNQSPVFLGHSRLFFTDGNGFAWFNDSLDKYTFRIGCIAIAIKE